MLPPCKAAGNKVRSIRLVTHADKILSGLCLLEGIVIRPLDHDRSEILGMRIGDFDTIPPAYGICEKGAEDALTLVAERDGKVIGQISAEIEVEDVPGTVDLNIELHVSGVFVDDRERGRGIGHILGEAMLQVIEDWRRELAIEAGKSLEGAMEIVADTLPASPGSAVEARMAERADELAEISAEEAGEIMEP